MLLMINIFHMKSLGFSEFTDSSFLKSKTKNWEATEKVFASKFRARVHKEQGKKQ